MSNISRRDFLKTAGVMTLAVAAAGVLAGCEGNTAKPEVPEITTNTVTANNYTLTLKDVKQFAVKEFNKGDGSNETNTLKTEDRYVIAVLNLKVVDEAKSKGAKDKPFTLIVKPENMISETIQDQKNSITVANVKTLFKLDQDPTVYKNKIVGYDVTSVKKGAGVDYVVAYKVDTVKYADVTEFKAPALSFVVNDSTGYTYTKMDAVIPAAVEVKKADLLK